MAHHSLLQSFAYAVPLAWNGLSIASNRFKSHFPKEACLRSQGKVASPCQIPMVGRLWFSFIALPHDLFRQGQSIGGAQSMLNE